MKRLFFLLAMAGFVFSSCATAPKLIPRKILFGNPAKAQAKISPDGKKIAYLAPLDGVLNVWVRHLDEGRDRAVTHDKNRGVLNYFWAQDSRHLMFLQDTGGDENTHLYSVELESGKMRDLTPFPGVQTQILFTDKHFPDEFLIAMNRENPKVHDVYRLHWRTGRLEIAAKNPGNVSQWIPDAHLTVRGAVVSGNDGGYDLLVRDSTDTPWKKIVEWKFKDNMTSTAIAFSKDGKSILLIDSRGFSAGRLVSMDLATGQKIILAEDPHSDVAQVVLHPDTYAPQMISFVKEKTEWIVFDAALREDIARIRRIHAGDFGITSRDEADRNWILRFESDQAPVAYYRYDRQTGKNQFLFEHQPELKKYPLAAIEPVSFPARDGLLLHGYLTFPPGKSRKKIPLVLKVHGGPWSRDTWGYDPRIQWLANRGYACLQVNYRGSTTYGKDFLNAGNKEWGGKMQEDLVDAVEWAVRMGIADPGRMAIFGGSYGGYAALTAAAFTPDLFRATIALFGPSNLVSFLKSTPPYWSTELANIQHRVGNPETEEMFLKSRSPLFKAGQIKTPLLIAQGANDPRVKKAESDQIVEAMRRRGVAVEYLLFADEGHGFAKPENLLKFYQAAERFLATHLGGRFEP